MRDSFDLLWVYSNTVGAYNNAEEWGFLDIELGFIDIDLETRSLERCQELAYILLVFGEGIAVDKDIVQVNR